MNAVCRWRGAQLGLLALLLFPCAARAATVHGDLQTWHRMEVHFAGPFHAESDSDPHPFLDYRLQCRFGGPSGQVYDVPGFFDASGGADPAGALWICRFAPDEPGTWTFRASFRGGSDVAVSLNPGAGTATSFDGETGSFTVSPSTKGGRDFRSPKRGRLVNTGGRYLTFLGSGDRWIKGGTNIPENLLGYVGFVRTPRARHTFGAHAPDWRSGDPDWEGGKGRGIIGALNYIAATGANSIYFLTMNLGGDGRDTFPTIEEADRTHYDTEKLRQWERVFAHASALGIFLHVQLNETEPANETYHDGGELGPERKLYYRELIARFAHHPGLQWDLGEENDFGAVRHRAFAAYLKALDPYDHPVTTHTRPNQLDQYYLPLLGNDDFDATAFQIGIPALRGGDAVWEWVERSARSGVPWMVSVDEPQRIDNHPTDEAFGYPRGRRFFLWPVYMSGGGGAEWYVQEAGGGHTLDQRLDDFREMDVALRWTGYALEFMNALPFWSMEPRPELGSSSAGGKTFVLARPGDTYALYNALGGSLSLDLQGAGGTFALRWFDPQRGRWFEGGSVSGGAQVDLGPAPFAGDVAALLVRAGDATPPVPEPPASEPEPPTVPTAPSDPPDPTDPPTATDPTDAPAPAPSPTPAGSPTLPLPDPANYRLVVSGSPVRENPALLSGAQLSGQVYIFVTPGTGIRQARFSLDGAARQVENVAPHDFAGGSVTTANPFDTRSVANGPHQIRALLELEDGRTVLVEASWSAANAAPAPAVPAPTADPGTTAVGDLPDYRLVVSRSPRRTAPIPLADAVLEGDVYVFVTPGEGIDQVRFYLDGMAGQLERFAPHDFAGGSVEVARPFQTRGVRDGRHHIKAELGLENGDRIVLEDSWVAANLVSVSSSSSPTPEPAAPREPEYQLVVSPSPRRGGAIPLGGAVLQDEVYIFVTPGSGVREARFFLDGMPGQRERFAPHDFAGGSVEIARPFDTQAIRDGAHRIRVELLLENGRRAVVEEDWVAANRTAASAPVAGPTATPAPDYRLVVSESPERSGARPLAGATLGGAVYVFVTPGQGIRQAQFYLNGMPGQLERFAPHDFAGGSVEIARPFDTRTVADGLHRIRVVLELENGRVQDLEDTWVVRNGAFERSRWSAPD